MTAEKGEHERAPPLCNSYPAPLRATLRAPPSKWAIGAFFPESPCRMLSLVLSFAPKESTIPRRGGSPITRAAVGASVPTGGRAGVCACGRTGGFPLAPSPLRIATRSNRAPHRAASPAPAPESARQSPPKGNCLRQSWRLSMQAGWLSARPPAPPSGRTRRENHRVSSQAKI